MAEKREYLVIVNFGRFQHYHSGKNAPFSPAWLKLYRTLRHDPDWARLPDVAKAHFVGLLMLAPDTRNCTLFDRKYLARELHCSDPFQAEALASAGFVRIYRGDRPRNFLGTTRDRPRKFLVQRREEEKNHSPSLSVSLSPPQPPEMLEESRRGIGKSLGNEQQEALFRVWCVKLETPPYPAIQLTDRTGLDRLQGRARVLCPEQGFGPLWDAITDDLAEDPWYTKPRLHLRTIHRLFGSAQAADVDGRIKAALHRLRKPSQARGSRSLEEVLAGQREARKAWSREEPA